MTSREERVTMRSRISYGTKPVDVIPHLPLLIAIAVDLEEATLVFGLTAEIAIASAATAAETITFVVLSYEQFLNS